MKYRWVTLDDITRWLVDGTVTEISFTDDAFTTEDFEPTGWYGMKLVKEFDEESMIFGKWGHGIEYADNLEDGIIGAIKNFFYLEFYQEINRGTLICCEAEGLPLVELFRTDDGFYNVEFNGDQVFTNVTKDKADAVKWALEKGIEYGKELSK